jgi:hypothetical protein
MQPAAPVEATGNELFDPARDELSSPCNLGIILVCGVRMQLIGVLK